MSKYQLGDLVRVARPSGRLQHWYAFGAVGRVADGPDCAGDYRVTVGVRFQYVAGRDLKLAKQAMRKRAQYAARRGGDPFEIPT